MASVGLDIGSYAIKVVRLSSKKDSFTVEAVGSTYNPVGQFLPENSGQQAQLAEAVKKLLTELKLSNQAVRLALPELQVFTNIISMPVLTEAELSSAIQWEAEQHLPVGLAEVNLEYAVLSRPKKSTNGDEKMKVLLVASKKELVERVLTFARQLGAEVMGLESVLLSVSRTFSSWSTDAPVLLCHCGALSTDMAVLDGGLFLVNHSVPTGGLALTRAIEKVLGLEPSQAEEYKRSYGLEEQELEGKVRGAILPVLNSIVAEIRKTVQYFQSEFPDRPVKRFILSGGGAYLPGLVSYLADAFSLEVVLGNPFERMAAEQVKLPRESALFSVAAGLAMVEGE